MNGKAALLGLAAILGLSAAAAADGSKTWEAEMLPPEFEDWTDPATGARVRFVTTHAADDANLYFHQRSWLPDESMLVFASNRTGRSEPYGYIEATGGLARLAPDGDPGFGFTAARRSNRIYLCKADGVYEWDVEIRAGDGKASKTVIHERKNAAFPDSVQPLGGLNESADGVHLSLILKHVDEDRWDIALIRRDNGEIERVCTVDWPVSHLQCSWETPGLMMFARGYPGGDRAPDTDSGRSRIWFVHPSRPEPRPLYFQSPGELTTHECWWTGDRLTFCGGYLPEESHVKTAKYGSDAIRIAGAGAWFPGLTPFKLSKRNWWHAAGSPDGRWIAADNWHGDIALFDGLTTRPRPLTMGHRVYGGGAHPHVGWAPSSRRVVFASNRRGNGDVCVARLP